MLYRMPKNFKDPEPATSEVSVQTFTCVLSQNRVSAAQSVGRIFCQAA